MRRLLSVVLILGLMLPAASLVGQVATVVQSTTDFTFTSSRSAVSRHHLEVRVNSKHGAETAVFSCACAEGISLSRFTGQVVDAQGRELLRIRQKDLTRSEYSHELATDAYGYYYYYEAHSYPYTVIYDWEVRIEGGVRAMPVFAPQPGYEVDVQQASYTITSPDPDLYHYTAVNLDVPPSVSTEGGRHVVQFAVSNLPALPALSYAVPAHRLTPRVYFAPLSFQMGGTRCDLTDWQTFGLWTHSLRQDRTQVPQALATQLDAITDTCTTTLSRIATVRRFMADNTRYVSIQGGIQGYQPMSVSQVYAKGIGDCKALVNYFCSMLQYLDIPADYVLISSNDARLRQQPSLQQLDHVIARVSLPDDTLWVECTNPYYPVTHLPADLADHDVLIVTPQGGVLARTPAYADADHLDAGRYLVELQANGQAQITYQEWCSGRIYDHYMSLLPLSATEQRRAMTSELGLPKSNISDLSISQQGDALFLRLGITSQTYAQRTGNRLFVPICPVPQAGLSNANEAAHDICLDALAHTRCDTIRFRLPQGATIEHLPEPVLLTSPFGQYSHSVTLTAQGEVEVVATITFCSGTYSAQQYPEWTAWRKAVATASATKMVVVL